MERKNLVNTLELVSRGLADNAMIPIFTCFSFTGNTVQAFNDQLGIIGPCVTDHVFAVKGALLLGLLKNSHVHDLDFSIEDEDLIVKAGRSTFKLPFLPEEEFVFAEPSNNWEGEIEVDDDFLKGLSACLLTSSRDQAQPALLGVNVSYHGKNVVLYSCDGDAISRFTTGTKSVKGLQDYMLPNSFCEAVLKIMGDTEADGALLSFNSEGWARVEIENGYTVYGRLIEIDNPIDYEKMIDKTLHGKPEFVRQATGIDQALSRARVIADIDSASTTMTVAKGRLKLLTQTSNGVVRDSLPFDKHVDVEARVSAALVQRSINLCDEMLIRDNCTAFRRADKLFIVISNMT